MKDYITVKMNSDNLYNMLRERVEYWCDDPDVVELYAGYYEELIDEGAFEGTEIDINYIVDNDWINWTTYGTLEELKDEYGDSFDEDNILYEYDYTDYKTGVSTNKELYLYNPF